MIQDAVDRVAGAEGFVGHVGGDDFVAVVTAEVAEDVAKRDLRAVRRERRSFYEAEDLERGSVQMEDRKGVDAGHPARARSRSASRPRPSARSPTTARRWRSPPR